MRQDQVLRLAELTEKIADVFIEEADPANWNGEGLALQDMDAQVRGDRLWDKKNAVQTGALLGRVLDLTDRSIRTNETDADVESEVKRYEKQARDILQRVQDAAKQK